MDKSRIPGVSQLADVIQRVAAKRTGRVPTGLLSLLPLAIFLDIVDSPLDLFGGPISMGIAWFLEAAFLLALTGKPSRALLYSTIDLVPGLDLVPFATITLVREIAKAWREPAPSSPVIDARVVRSAPAW